MKLEGKDSWQERVEAEEQRFLDWFLERKGSSRTIKSGSKRHFRYVHYELCNFIILDAIPLYVFGSFKHICHRFSLCFIDLAWKTDEDPYSIHSGASRDRGRIFALNLFMFFFHQHEPIDRSWDVVSLGFYFSCFVTFLILMFFSSTICSYSFFLVLW